MMFTGIIHNQGVVEKIAFEKKSARIRFRFRHREKKVVTGESIAVNGVCLTASQISPIGFSAYLLPETLESTNLGQLEKGTRVNLERSLRAGDAIGGHFVTGHVDAAGTVIKIERRGRNWSLLVGAPETIISKLAVKGSIACDGVSLTVQAVRKHAFCAAIIPHTLKSTNLSLKRPGSRVNLEIDILMRYLEQAWAVKRRASVSVQKLKRQGF